MSAAQVNDIDEDSDELDEDYIPDEECQKEKRTKKRKRKRKQFGAAILSDGEEDFDYNPHATAELDEAEEDSNSEIDDMFKAMQRGAINASKPKVKKGSKKNIARKKKKDIKIPGLSMGSAPPITFESDDEEEGGEEDESKPSKAESVVVKEVKDYAGEKVM